MKFSKADLPPTDQLAALIDSEGRLAVRVTPGARSECISLEEGRVLMKVRVKPQDGAANGAARRLLAKGLGIAPSRIDLLRGATSREKQFLISDYSMAGDC